MSAWKSTTHSGVECKRMVIRSELLNNLSDRWKMYKRFIDKESDFKKSTSGGTLLLSRINYRVSNSATLVQFVV